MYIFSLQVILKTFLQKDISLWIYQLYIKGLIDVRHSLDTNIWDEIWFACKDL